MLSQVLAHQHSAPLEESRVKENNTDLHQVLEVENSKRKSLIGNFPSNAITFQTTLNSKSNARVCATSRSPFSSPSSCLGHGLRYLQEATLWLSIGPGASRPGRDHPCTFWSLVHPRGSHLPKELLDSFGIWNNSTSKSTKTNKVSELRFIVT